MIFKFKFFGLLCKYINNDILRLNILFIIDLFCYLLEIKSNDIFFKRYIRVIFLWDCF